VFNSIKIYFSIVVIAFFFGGNFNPSASAAGGKNKNKTADFRESLANALALRGASINGLCDESDAIERRVLGDYGAMFLIGNMVQPPPVCVFSNAEQVVDFHKQIQVAAAKIGGVTIELQAAAMKALLAARAEAANQNLNITPRDGAEAARRSYDDTVRLWNSRFFPALKFWQRRGELTAEDAERLSLRPIREQVRAVLEYEKRGVYFSRDFSKSIFYSVAPPGASQHLSLIAFDANEFADEKVRRILARHGWFRTVKDDSPHFTFLGLAEKDLPASGLRKIKTANGEFWIPDNR
jgi:hypothetical protein